jgi:hypothetical protein
VPPVLQKPSGFWGHLPLGRIGKRTPCVYMSANIVDD